MSQKQKKTFGPDTWAKGTRGLLGPWATDLPQIVNMRRSVDGSLVPRPWFEESADLTTRTDLNAVVFPARYYNSGLAGYFDGFFFADATSSAVYGHGGGTLATGAGLTGVTRFDSVTQIDGTTWLVQDKLIGLAGLGTISITDAGASLEAIFSPSALFSINVEGSTVHQGRAFYWGEEVGTGGVLVQNNRIYYSDPYDYTSFTSASQSFDVDSSVEGCASVGANLFIWTVTGDWYILQGRGDPADGTLNSIGIGPTPSSFSDVVRQDNSLYFLAADKTRIVRLSEGGLFDDVSLSHLGFDPAGELPSTNAAPAPTAGSVQNSLFVPNDNDSGERDAIHWWNQTWTEEDYGSPITNSRAIMGTSESESREMLAQHDGTSWHIYRRDIVINAPQESPASYEENAQGTLSLPRISDPQYPIRITKIIIDARYWKGTLLPSGAGPFLDPAMSLSASDGKGNTTSFNLGPESNVFASLADGEGAPIRIVGTPDVDGMMPHTHFADITLSGIQSLAIERVHVEYEISNGRNH